MISTARFKAIDAMRRRAHFDGAQRDLDAYIEEPINEAPLDDEEIEDDRLRLIFTCCHPALPPVGQVAFTLREICGLTTEEIARAFEARDMKHAVQLMAQHPALTYGNIFEIRPTADMSETMKASERRRRKNTAR